ncbi:hypothetical protein FVE85_4700 [Porphyridium purpureum]|uniref:Nuclear pore complex protein Nup85 n=1 Tax=Porphyridium purpureum TaxID=35688 RepID=A0A5J4YRY3_PORPP|nr:hypothetical protein FVE85_4700 [Porphyridium purpureum]|eukprot:POR9741..scf236_6
MGFSWGVANDLVKLEKIYGLVEAGREASEFGPVSVPLADSDVLHRGLIQELVIDAHRTLLELGDGGQGLSALDASRQIRASMRRLVETRGREHDESEFQSGNENDIELRFLFQVREAEQLWAFAESVFLESLALASSTPDIADRVAAWYAKSIFADESVHRRQSDWWAQAAKARHHRVYRGGRNAAQEHWNGLADFISENQFWALCTRVAALGNLTDAADMVRFVRKEVGEIQKTAEAEFRSSRADGEQLMSELLQKIEALDEDLNLAEAALLDGPADGSSARYDGRWKSWQEDCFSTVEALGVDVTQASDKEGAEDGAEDASSVRPVERLLLLCSGTDPRVALECTESWMEALVAVLLYSVYPAYADSYAMSISNANQAGVRELELGALRAAHEVARTKPRQVDASTMDTDSEDNCGKNSESEAGDAQVFDPAFHAVANCNAAECVAQVAFAHIFFHAAHLAELLAPLLEDSDAFISAKGLGLRDHYFLEYATTLQQDPSLWRVALDYHAQVDQEQTLPERLVSVLNRLPLDDPNSDPQIDKIIALCESRGWTQVLIQWYERLGASCALKQQTVPAIYWFLRAYCRSLVREMAHKRQRAGHKLSFSPQESLMLQPSSSSRAVASLRARVLVNIYAVMHSAWELASNHDAGNLMQDVLDTIRAGISVLEAEYPTHDFLHDLLFLEDVARMKQLLGDASADALKRVVEHGARALRSGGLPDVFALLVVFDVVCALDNLDDLGTAQGGDPSELRQQVLLSGVRRQDIFTLLDALEECSEGNNRFSETNTLMGGAFARYLDLFQEVQEAPDQVLHRMRQVLLRTLAEVGM